MHLTLFISKRYLFAKKSHNVINIISVISAAGIAIGTAALIIILSVYNGFEGLIKSLYSTYESDLLITPATGKSFSPKTAQFNQIRNNNSVAAFCEIVQENVFVKYGNQESVATIKGVDSTFSKITHIKEYIKEGEFSLYHGETPQAIMGRSMAFQLGLRVHFIDPLQLYFPSRNRALYLVNPTSSLNLQEVFPAGLFTLDQNFDKKYIFIPIEIARNLLEYENEVSSVEIYTKEGVNINQFKEEVKKSLGPEYLVKDRYEQNETLYKMMKSEKVSIYIILLFILIIISCNLFGSLSMLIIEKREDAKTLKALGANNSLIKRIFLLEGWMISLLGIFIGVAVALFVSFIQQQFGIIPMPGNFIVDSYPIIVKLQDVVLTICGVAVIGLFSAMLPFLIVKKIENF
ncbi:MAG: ABC transporter permease [Bacteroidales bacterium]|nr:ABC transporter permease [Bacteroidales bacterium]